MHAARALVALAVLANASVVSASPVFVTAKVTQIQSSSVPTSVVFNVDASIGGCSSGNWVSYQPSNTENAKAVYAGLLAAMLSDKTVYLTVDNAVCPYAGVALCTLVTVTR